MKYWEIIADNLSKAGWSWGWGGCQPLIPTLATDRALSDCLEGARLRKLDAMPILFAIKARFVAAGLLAELLVSFASAQSQFIYVANAGEDTVSKIDITQNKEVARYATWFNSGTNPNYLIKWPLHAGNPWAGPAPSRIAQDSAGNVYVLDRFFSLQTATCTNHSSNNQAHRPVLLKIAPSVVIPTSIGPLAITDSNNNDDIDSGEATDKLILWAKPIPDPIGQPADNVGVGRAVAVDPTGNLWVGMYCTKQYYKVDPNTGKTIGGPISTKNHTPYGAQVDVNGKLWSVDENNTLAEIDTNTNTLVTILDHSNFNGMDYGQNYALSLFNDCTSTPRNVMVYLSEHTKGRTYIVYDPQNSKFSNSPGTIPQFNSVAIAVDSNGDIVSGEWNNTGRVIKTTPKGTVKWDTNTLPAGPVVPPNTVPLLPKELRGIIIDKNNDVWAVHLWENRVVKYSGLDGHWLATVPVGDSPYTYANSPPPTCPCAEIGEHPITCEGQSGATPTYSWSFTFTNHSPFSASAAGINISSSQVTNLTPTHVQFTNPVAVNGQATVSGTFTVANPVPGTQVCLDIRLDFGEAGWCCPVEHVCFVLPECPTCAKLQGQFQCQNGQPVLQLAVTNLGPSAAQGVQVFSNTPGVTITPQMTMQTFPQNMPVTIPLTVTGATAGQTISLTVNLHGPINSETGVYSWCCTGTVTVKYPSRPCPR